MSVNKVVLILLGSLSIFFAVFVIVIAGKTKSGSNPADDRPNVPTAQPSVSWVPTAINHTNSNFTIESSTPENQNEKTANKTTIPDVSADVVVFDLDSPQIQRVQFIDRAVGAMNSICKRIDEFKKLERTNGVITHTHPNGEKNSIDVHDEKGNLIGKLVYLNNDRLSQVSEWKDGMLNGFAAFISKEGLPYKIYHFKDNILEGPFYQFEAKGELKGSFTSYVEFKENNRVGYCLGWTPDGQPIKGCRFFKNPVPWNGMP